MKRTFFLAALLLLIAQFASADVILQPGTTVRIASTDEAARLLGTDDAWIDHLSPFDKSAMLGKSGPITTQEILHFMSRQALPFSETEARKMEKALEGARDRIAASKLKLRFPPIITVIKTTAREQGDAAYCRGPIIVVPKMLFDLSVDHIEEVMVHELFHVMTTWNPQIRKPLFAIIGFHQCSEVKLPVGLESRRITNPDEFRNNYYANVHCMGEEMHVLVVLIAKSEYDPAKDGAFEDYLTVKLMPVEDHDGTWEPVLADGKPILLEPSDSDDFFDEIGRNTGYILGPEEIMAENFRELIMGSKRIRTPRIIEEMRQVLSLELSVTLESTASREIPAAADNPAAVESI